LTGEWFTYRQAAELLSVSPEAVRQRAKRGRWQKTLGNDKRTRIRPPDGWNDAVRASGDRVLRARVLDERALANQVIRALESHVETLKAQLAAAEQRAEKQAAEFAAREARHAADLAVERTLADRMSARVDQMTADMAIEQAQRADSASFESLDKNAPSKAGTKHLATRSGDVQSDAFSGFNAVYV
jgi:DNA primase